MNQLADSKQFMTDDLEIIDLFRKLITKKEKIWVWQQVGMGQGPRPIHFAIIKRIDPIKKIIEVDAIARDGFRFKADQNIFIYSKTNNIATKFKAKWLEKEFFAFPIPKRLNILSEELAERIAIIEKDNEQEHMHKRTTPRKKSTDGFVVLSIVEAEDKAPHTCELYDISSGGMGLKVSDPGEFISGLKLTITNINGKDLPTHINGEVMSIREMPEDGRFKVGVRFY